MARLTLEWKGYFLWSDTFIIMMVPRLDKDVAQYNNKTPKKKNPTISESNINIYSAGTYYLKINQSGLIDQFDFLLRKYEYFIVGFIGKKYVTV